MKAYIKVDVTKELPPKEGKAITNLQLYSQVLYAERLGFYVEVPNIVKVNPEWFLKEIDLSDLMIEFAQRIIDEDWNYTGWTKEDVLNKFLTEKGYITNNQNNQPKTKNKTY